MADLDNIGYCNFHEEQVRWKMFDHKGYWLCSYFDKSKGWLYADDAAKKYNVYVKTIYRWIKKEN